MKRIWQWLKNNIIRIASIDSTPLRIALGIGLGTLIAMFPITGFQFITGLILSFLFRINKIAVVVTTQLVCNPLTLPLLIFFNFKLGGKIIGIDTQMTLSTIKVLLKDVNIRNFFAAFSVIAKPIFLGSAVTGPLAGSIAFAAGYYVIKKYKERHIKAPTTKNLQML